MVLKDFQVACRRKQIGREQDGVDCKDRVGITKKSE